MDYEEMRNAMNRAIELFKLHQCNMCGNLADQNDGEFVDLVLSDKIIRIWECKPCLDEKDDDF